MVWQGWVTGESPRSWLSAACVVSTMHQAPPRFPHTLETSLQFSIDCKQE